MCRADKPPGAKVGKTYACPPQPIHAHIPYQGPHMGTAPSTGRDITEQNRQIARGNIRSEGHKQKVRGEKRRQWADCMKHKNLGGVWAESLTAPCLLPRALQVATKDTGRVGTANWKALG